MSKSERAMTVRHFDQITIKVAESAIKERDEAINEAAGVVKVSNEFNAGIATRARKRLYDLKKSMESARKLAKAPVLEFGRTIDSTAKEFSSDLDRELERIDRLISEYWQRVADEKAAKERAAREAAEKAEAEARRLAAEAEKAEQPTEEGNGERRETSSFATIVKTTQAVTLAADARAEAKELEKAKPSEAIAGSGMTVVSRKDFEVVDLAELAAKHPDLVTITVKRQAVLFAIKDGREISGIRVFETNKPRATGGGR